MGLDTGDQRCGVDIVAVLDVSGSMSGKKLEKLKTAMKFLVKKLSPIDRLSIVTFSRDARRLCPLTVMHKDGQANIEMLINKLRASGGTNITPGLQIASSMLAERKQQEGRTSAIMLMSDGALSSRCVHPSTVDVSGVPVHTFGLGKDHDSQLLQEIASRSDKGTYSIADVEGSDSASLNIAFSSCLAGLLSSVVQDLELTIIQMESEIQELRAGNYDQARVNESVVISFGNLYNHEKRNTTVFLSLPAVQVRTAIDIVQVTFSYRPSGGGALIKSAPITATVSRTSSPVTVDDPVEVGNEVARGDIVAAMQTARKQADAKDFDEAMKTLDNAGKSIDNLNRDADELIKALNHEVQEFLRLIKNPRTYREGCAFALSSELSHNLQRFAVRGDATQLLTFAIPLAVLFANQAIEFEKNIDIEISNKMGRMSTNYDDDEPIPVPSGVPTLSDGLGPAKIVQNIFSKADSPLEKNDYSLVVELMGLDTGEQIYGVDIIAVLDMSGSMSGKKLEKLKTAMKFLVKKRSPIDRLSIVTFSLDARRLCPLTGMHKDGQTNIEMLINNLDADGGTNITPGLQTALTMLVQRRQHEGRTSAIMLMSDGELSPSCDHPSTVDVSGVPVYTFGLGRYHDSQLLQEIASRSDKGTYSIADVEGSNSASLNIAFASCLAGLLSVVVQDLELTITQKESELHEVCAGSYDQTRVNESVTISFGNLYHREKLNTTVFLSLPAIQDGTDSDILEVTYSYRPSGGGALIKSAPITATVTRTSSPVTVDDPVEVGNEIARGDTAAAMQSARKQADANDFDGAMKTLEYAGKLLDNLNREVDELVKALKYEVQEFSRLLNDPRTYLREGRAFALSSELSHNLQRFAARGDATQLLALAIPLAVPFTNQAIEFDQNLNIEVPSADEDMRKVAEQTAKLDKAAEEEKKELDEQE
ncbi:uncharacterized protein LOC141655132 [Silene latifolia]|uniref:uncharacterized protein LOC141655132 n=1 Tax=Silene latifolia TaxID=37657 RepID=UPI003D782C09